MLACDALSKGYSSPLDVADQNQGGKDEFTPTTSGGVFQYTGAHSILFPISFYSADPYVLVNVRDNPGFCSATATGNVKTGCVLNVAGLDKQYQVYYLAVGW